MYHINILELFILEPFPQHHVVNQTSQQMEVYSITLEQNMIMENTLMAQGRSFGVILDT